MKDFEALKSIWHNQVALPEVSHGDILARVRKNKKGLANRLLMEIIGMVSAVIILGYFWSVNPYKLWTTHLAMILILVCCLYYIFALINDFRRISDSSAHINTPQTYIIYLKKYKHDRYILNTQKYRIYTFIIGIAILLGFIEIGFIASVWITIAGLLFTVLWILFCYFILMRNYIRKEEAKLEEMIGNLERLQKQFEMED